MAISGRTHLYCLLGDPVGGSLSPFIHNHAFRRLGIDAVYTAQRVPRGSFDTALSGLRALGACGANVTHPHKAEAARRCDRPSERVAVLGAANHLRFGAEGILAENTDASGIVLAVERFAGMSPRGARAVVFGAGGAARAAALGLLEAGAGGVSFVARDSCGAEAAIAPLRQSFPDRWVEVVAMGDRHARRQRREAITEAQIVIQATTIGMGPAPASGGDGASGFAPLDEAEWIRPDQLCVEYVYQPQETAFAAIARRRGARVLDGVQLLVAQACEGFRLWTGQALDPADVLAAIDATAAPRAASPPSAAGRPLVVLTGFMGTGKTETARALAALIGSEWVDTDALIETREGMSVAEIFARHGEARFRAMEAEICRELGERNGIVVSTGGGTLLAEENLAALARRGTVVLLEASREAILARLVGDRRRPLAQGPDGAARLIQLLEERAPSYARIPRRIDTTRLTPERAAARIAARLDLPQRATAIEPRGAPPTRIEVGRGLIATLGARMAARGLASRAFVCLPAVVRERFGDTIAASFEAAGIAWEPIAVRDGDREKTLAQAAELLDRLAERGAERDASLVAIGGGVTGDLAGFVASIYMRGVPLVLVPTTLLAQVDAAIGGKVGVNAERAKNLIGSFHPPRLVVSDPCVLGTLPDREIANGMAEVVKTALLGSAAFFDYLERELDHDLDGPGRSPALRRIDFLERCVAESTRIKGEIVERDPFEAGERRVLNLGHTVGHALEAAGRYAGLAHGEAVAIGLVAALRVAVARGRASAETLEATRRVLRRCGLPLGVRSADPDALHDALGLDKKRRAGRLHFVLPLAPGSVEIVDDVTEAELIAALGEEVGA